MALKQLNATHLDPGPVSVHMVAIVAAPEAGGPDLGPELAHFINENKYLNIQFHTGWGRGVEQNESKKGQREILKDYKKRKHDKPR